MDNIQELGAFWQNLDSWHLLKLQAICRYQADCSVWLELVWSRRVIRGKSIHTYWALPRSVLFQGLFPWYLWATWASEPLTSDE